MSNDKCQHCKTMIEAIDAFSIEMNALKDVRDILMMIPVENAPPHYLVNRVIEHVNNLDDAFERIYL